MSNMKEKFADFEITKKWRVWTAVSAGIVLIAVLFVAIFNFRLAFDFDLSGSATVEVGTYLTFSEDKYEEFEEVVLEVLDEMKIDYSAPQQLKSGGMLIGLNIKFSKVVNGKVATEEQLDIIGKLINGRQDDPDMFGDEDTEIRYKRATGTEAAKVQSLLSGTEAHTKLNAKGDFSKGETAVEYKGIYDRVNDLGISVKDLQGNDVVYPAFTLKITAGAETAGMNFGLFWNFLLVFGIAVVAIFLYTFWRFGLVNAITSIALVLHNIIIFVALAAITRVVIGASFAGILAIVAAFTYYNLAVLFSRIKENKAKSQNADWTNEELAEKSVKQNLGRTAVVLLATLGVFVILLVAAAITAVPQFIYFTVSVIIGLVAATYGNIFITPAVHVCVDKLIENRKKNGKKVRTKAPDKK